MPADTPVRLQHGANGAAIATTSTQISHGAGSLPGQRAVRSIDRGENYPGRSELNVLAPEAESIRVYDEANIRRCITELLGSNPDDGGEMQLDQHVPPGVSFTPVPVEESGFTSWVGGDVDGWDGRVGEQRGTAEWVVPDDCDMSCRIVFVHGGLNMWYGGCDPVYRPATARFAKAARMPLLSIDFRLAPEHPFPASTEDAVAAVRWLRETYPGAGGPSPASKIFLLGDSSGGGVALSAALVAKREGIAVDGCCAICPATGADTTCFLLKTAGFPDGKTPNDLSRQARAKPSRKRKKETKGRFFVSQTIPSRRRATVHACGMQGVRYAAPPQRTHTHTHTHAQDSPGLYRILRSIYAIISLALRAASHTLHGPCCNLPLSLLRNHAWCGSIDGRNRLSVDGTRCEHIHVNVFT
jgi:acetyl esterase/lipase